MEVYEDNELVIKMVHCGDKELFDGNDAVIIRALIQELADFQKMSDGPKISADQLREDLRSGVALAFLLYAKKEHSREVAGYVIYFPSPSSQFGNVIFLEDIYIRPQFRRRKFGFRIMRQIAKMVADQIVNPVLMWDVLASNHGAINFYASLGANDMTKKSPYQNCWRIEKKDFDKVLCSAKANAARNLLPEDLRIRIMVNDGKSWVNYQPFIDRSRTFAEYWNQLGGHDGFNQELASMFFDGLSVVMAMDCETEDGEDMPKIDNLLGMALFHRKAYSTWLGPCLTIDSVRVRPDARNRGIGTRLVAEIVQLAKTSNMHRVGWTAPEAPLNDDFSISLGADNITDREGWLLYKWDFEQQCEWQNMMEKMSLSES